MSLKLFSNRIQNNSDIQGCMIATREAGNNEELKNLLAKRFSDSFEIVELPAIQTEITSDFTRLQGLSDRLNEFDGIIITSPQSAQIFLSALTFEFQQIPTKIYCVGNATARVILKRFPGQDVFKPTIAQAETMVREMNLKKFSNILFITSENSEAVIYRSLILQDMNVTLLRTYRTVSREWKEQDLFTLRRCFDYQQPPVFLLASPSTALSVTRNLDDKMTLKSKAVCIGSTTATTVEQLPFGKIYIARFPGLEGMMEATEEAAKDSNIPTWMRKSVLKRF
eukprot:GDKJ01035382.1.p1 GENE.GDKJ01035382.1~~GDKJ01035382.1.p1  ORF type:complete len:290 (+),score=42.28 GDKJ01035382.1:26-871(+)